MVPWAVLASGMLLALAAPGSTANVAPWTFVVALFVFGMPHGAADWAVAARLGGRSSFLDRLAGFSWYLALMTACTALVAWQPGVAALLFLALTVFHFGMADSTAVHADEDGEVVRWCLVVGRGLLLLATAFAADARSAWTPFGTIAEAAPGGASSWMPDLSVLRTTALVGAASGGAIAAIGCAARALRGQPRTAALDLAEHGLVAALAALADPLFAVGCYFVGVHAFRHSRRLACTRVVIEPPPAPRSLLLRLVRVHAMSLPLMPPTAFCLWLICVMIGGFGPREIATSSICFYMISTLPHHLLGLRLPRPDSESATMDRLGPASVTRPNASPPG